MHLAADIANITVATYNRLDCTKVCLESLRNHTRQHYSLTVVDNGSSDGTPAYLTAEHDAGRIENIVLLEQNMGVACAYNLGWSLVQAAYYLKVDNDVEFLRQDWLDVLIHRAASEQAIAMLGFGCNNSGLTFTPSASAAPAQENDLLHYCGHVGGVCLIRSDVHERLGYWNEDYGLYGEEDSDFGLRARLAGYSNIMVCQRERPYIRYVDTLGADFDTYQSWKSEQRQRNVRAMFLLNDALFKCGFRELYVGRKYIPRVAGAGYSFTLDKEYVRSLAELQHKYTPHLSTILDSAEFKAINEELGFNFWY